MRFRLATAEEVAVRGRLEELVAAWNAGNRKAVEDLEARGDDFPGQPSEQERFLRAYTKALAGSDKCRIQLEEDLSYLRFYGPEVASVRQSFSCLPSPGAGAAKPMPRPLDLTVAKGPRGWRFVLMSEAARAWASVLRVGGSIPEPRRTKDVPPDYPAVAKEARVQGIVILDSLVSAEGKVAGVAVLRAIPLMDEAAARAVRQWEFEPTVVDGVPVPVIVTVQFDFKLGAPKVEYRVLPRR